MIDMAKKVSCAPKGANADRKNYSMYVWRDGYDPLVAGCGIDDFLSWNKTSPCFTHTWSTQAKQQWLWATCNVPGREVSKIFLSDVYHKLKPAFLAKNCDSSVINLLRTTLSEGHSHVPNLQIYALFAASDAEVSERHMVPYVVWYNDHCARSRSEKFDGVAVNNEAYSQIKCSKNLTARTTYLDRLQEIHQEAEKHARGHLLTHFSVGWHWGLCDGLAQPFVWGGKSADAVHHMIDIFDSVDVQVAATKFPTIRDRMLIAGMEYALSLGKQIYATLYTDKVDPSQTSFFPTTYARSSNKSEVGLYNVIDQFHQHGLGQVQPCIHYFRGVYSSGGHPDWPDHKTS